MIYFRKISIRLIISSTWLHCHRTMSIQSSVRSTRQQFNKIAVSQLCSTSSKFNNLINIAKCAGWAKYKNCNMLFLPECFGFIGENSQQTLQYAEQLPSSIIEKVDTITKNTDIVNQYLIDMVNKCCSGTDDNSQSTIINISSENISILDGLKIIAKESNLWISGGGIHIAGAPPNIENLHQQPRVYNTHIIMDNYGNIQSTYRKIHLFDVSIPGKVNLQESATTAPGTELKVCNSPIGCLGITVCYDVRFPETYTALVKQGAQIMLVPSAFTVPTGTAHWHTLLKARAIETQCYVIAAAQYGQHNEKRESFGHSIVIDPWGDIIADAGGCLGPGTTNEQVAPIPPTIITCEIDINHLESIRQRMPIQQHRNNASI